MPYGRHILRVDFWVPSLPARLWQIFLTTISKTIFDILRLPTIPLKCYRIYTSQLTPNTT
jgi:hypothetical protein